MQDDAVVCAAGNVTFKQLGEMTAADFEVGLRDKLMGQVNLVLLGRVDGHAELANARALAAAGLLPTEEGGSVDVPRIEGGRVIVDDAGLPTGVLIDNAVGLVAQHVPEPDRATRRRRLARAQSELLAQGLVAVHDMGSPPSTVELLRELEAAGELQLRVFVYLSEVPPEPELGELLRANDPDARVNVAGVKLMVDGALGSRGAALLEDYADEAGHRGLSMWEAAAFEERVDELTREYLHHLRQQSGGTPKGNQPPSPR